MTAPTRPLLVFDGDCGFCRRWLARIRRLVGDAVDYVPYQAAPPAVAHIPRERFAQAIHLVEPEGRVSSGAEAIFRALALVPGRRWPLRLYEHVPLAAPVSEAVYRTVARHRPAADHVTTWLWGEHVVPPGEARTIAVFLRLMGGVYVAAFVSLWVQVSGLIGSDGILPVQGFLSAARSQLGTSAFWLLPSLFWLHSGDAMLHVVCAVGTVAALLVVAGIVPVGTLGLAWISYLSLSSVGQDFLRFQWDALLLEAGFVAILLAPWRLRSRLSDDPPPSRAALWLARWLLFRLMFSSAVVKLTSGDPTWRSLTALDFHYFTQPLPPWTAWYASHLPPGLQKLSALLMFASEGVAPFLLFGPRRVRFTGVAAIAGLQVLILLTGNYGFFNLLTLVLCVPALDDGFLSRRSSARGRLARPTSGPTGKAGRWSRRAVAAALFLMSLVPLSRALRVGVGWLGPVATTYRLAAPLQLVNPYGLFAVMTTQRSEIVLEGSSDGREWLAYEFKYKPGDVGRRPRFVTPHMPRLDWQMWFAALGTWRQSPWFLDFCQRLLQGSSSVTGLLAQNPFPDAPPRFLRAQVYRYRFTDQQERERTGNWWTRTLEGAYLPTLTLVDGRLSAVGDPSQ